MSAVARSRPGRVARPFLHVLIAVGLVAAGHYLWNGPPYPKADPDAVAARLKARAQRVYDEAALAGTPGVESRVETRPCSYRGLRGFAHIDGGRLDVRTFELMWQVTDVPRATARSAQARTRLRLERDGWKLLSENVSDLGFRFEHPGTGDTVDVDWYEPTGTFALRTFSSCGELPDGFSEYDWPAAAWTPR
ncbi:hypothetical protein ACIP8Z_04190 [Streptomyces sp. NPDC088553]|uniref:hypothetical protein n=1 Tax=Streptomyces sp. NPDC088553 TaxID=3365864 RepID=UPI0038012D13